MSSPTVTITITTCSGTNPTTSFDLQIVDSTPTRTDSFNLLYPTPTQNADIDPDFYTFDYLPTPPAGLIYNIDCVGRLYVENPDGGAPLYANIDYFSPGFEVV